MPDTSPVAGLSNATSPTVTQYAQAGSPPIGEIREITGKIQELLGESGPYELGFAPASGLSGG